MLSHLESKHSSRFYRGEECFGKDTHAGNLRMKSFSAPKECLKEEGSRLRENITLVRNCKVLSDGRCLHARIARTGHDQETVLGNLLIQMYGNCGSPEDAREVFERLQQCNVFSWTIMMAAYVQNHEDQKALQLFWEMDVEGMKPDRITFINVLSACSSLGALAEGKAIHARIIASVYSEDLVTGTALLNMYGKCGSIDETRWVFQEMQQKDLVSWNAMLSAYVQNGYAAEALGFFKCLLLEGIKPNKITFKCILSACSTLKALAEGQLIHALVVASGFESDSLVGAALINVYCKCKCMNLAVVVLHGGPWNLLSCNILIGAYSQHGDSGNALRLFWQMHLEGVKPDKVTFMSALGACCSLQDVSKGKAIHVEIVASGLHLDAVTETALVKMYAACNRVNDARRVFLGMKQRDMVSWNAMIAAFALSGLCKEALNLFWQMNLEGVKPNELTFSSIFYACASLGAQSEGRSIHAWIMGGEIEADVAVGTALVNMYSKGGNMVDAVSSFYRIARGDTVSWNALIVAFAQHGHCLKSLQMLSEMSLQGVEPDETTFCSILHACSHAGLLNEGWQCFLSMSADHGMIAGKDHYCCMIDLLGRAGRVGDVEELLNSMPFEPDEVGWNAMLAACKVHGNMERGTSDAAAATAAAERILGLVEDSAPYVLLSHIYAQGG